jgi:CRP/FNR family transcriptional regulator, cyclic AMP receptor protein
MSGMEHSVTKKESICRYLATEELKSIFKFLPEEEIETLCAYFELAEVPAEATLMAEGEAGDFMGFLVKGKLAVKKETPFPGKYILLAILEPGTMVGEISFMEEGKRNATVTVMEHCQLLIVNRRGMDELIEMHPIIGIKFLKRIIQVLSLRLQKADDRLAKLL